MKGLIVTITPQRNTDIRTACESAKELSEFIKTDIEFEFNGVRITTKNMSINEMIDSYLKQR